MKLAVKVEVIESEKGWGSKTDDYMVCLTPADAMEFQLEFNSKNNENPNPDWYMKAVGVHSDIYVTDRQYEKLLNEGNQWLSELNKIQSQSYTCPTTALRKTP